MHTVALTGPLGSGKSTVSHLLEAQGAEVVSADEIGHRLLESGSPAYQEVRERYGEQVCNEDGSIDRKALGALVFSDPEQLSRFNAIVHPHLIVEILDIIEARRAQSGVLVIDAALIYEWGIEHEFDTILLVTADYDVRQRRIKERDNLDAKQFEKRDKAQPGRQTGARPPDFTIKNNGDFDELQHHVLEFWKQIGGNGHG